MTSNKNKKMHLSAQFVLKVFLNLKKCTIYRNFQNKLVYIP